MRMKMTVFVGVVWLLGVLVFAGQILVPVAPNSRILKAPTPALLLISDGIYAEPTPSIGQAAFDECMKTGNGPVCEPVRASAIRYDAERRVRTYVNGLHDVNANASETALTSERLFLVK